MCRARGQRMRISAAGLKLLRVGLGEAVDDAAEARELAHESRHRRECHVDSPWSIAAPPRPPRGHFAEACGPAGALLAKKAVVSYAFLNAVRAVGVTNIFRQVARATRAWDAERAAKRDFLRLSKGALRATRRA